MERARFDRILECQRHRVYGFALRCLRDPDDAEDITQEAFLRLWRRGPDLDDERLIGWLICVTHNLCIDRSRRDKVRNRYSARSDAAALADLPAAAEPPAAPAEDHADLLAAVGALPVATRSLLWLHYWQGLKLGEIAAALGVNQSTVKVRLHRARRALRDVLAQPPAGLIVHRQEQNG